MSRRMKDLLKENNRTVSMLSEEGQRTLTDIVVYLRSMPITMYQQEIIRSDITQMLIDGENRGSSVKDVIGNDYREFCENIVKEFPPLDIKYKILSRIRDLLPALIILIALWCFGKAARIASGILPSFLCPVTAGDLISGLLILFAADRLITYICRHSFQESRSWSIRFGLLIAAVLALVLLVNTTVVYVLFHIHLIHAVLAIPVLLLIYKLVDTYTD